MEQPSSISSERSGPGPPAPIPFMPMYSQTTTVMPFSPPRPTQSCPLIGFGILLLLVSGTCFCTSAWLTSELKHKIWAGVSLGCSLPFLLLASLCIFGGCDVKRRRCTLIVALLTALIFLIAAVISAIFNMAGYASPKNTCKGLQNCEVELKVSATSLQDTKIELSAGCNKMCQTYIDAHLAMAALSGVEALIAIILSIASCCNVCTCCCCYEKDDYPGFVMQANVVHPPSYVSSIPTHPPQWHNNNKPAESA